MYFNVEPVNIDSDGPSWCDLCVAVVDVPGLHLKSRKGLTNMAVLGEGVGAATHEGVVTVIEGGVEVAHHPAGAGLWW